MNLKFYMVKNENKFETLIWIIKNKKIILILLLYINMLIIKKLI